MATAPQDSRRAEILRAAAQVIVERGFRQTRVADVARAAGVSPGLVIYYFGTLDALLTGALRYSEDRFYAAVSRHLGSFTGPRQRLDELVRISCSLYALDGLPASWVLWLDLWAQAVRHPGVGRDREELDERWRSTIAELVRQGQAGGDFPADVDPRRFALTLTALLDGLSVQVALGDPVVTSQVALSVASDLCARWLGPS